MRELKIEIFGRVQGVGFRHFTKENADKLGLKGYVKNNSDGSVTAIVQGEKENLDVFLHNVQKGPVLAKVEGVSYFWQEKTEDYNDFVISLDKGLISDQTSSFKNLGKKIFNIKDKVPVHVAIIPDGNRRWAKEKGLHAWEGHIRSKDNLNSIFQEAKSLGVRYLTIWAFSTENWSRSSSEVTKLFSLLEESINGFRKLALENKIRFRHLGRRDRFPKRLMHAIGKLEDETKDFSDYNVQICLDYGGRDEVLRAVNKMLRSGLTEIKEDDLTKHLDSADIPDPDLIIRTSGEKRVSGFMPFQATYAELYFTDVNFPDFGPEHLRKAVEDYSRRKRRFGG